MSMMSQINQEGGGQDRLFASSLTPASQRKTAALPRAGYIETRANAF